MKRRSIAFWVLGALAASGMLACDDDPTAPQTETIVGEILAVGNGTARSWVTVQAGKPIAVGVTFTAGALDGLPVHPTAFNLSLPWQAAAASVDHIGFDWNPGGHPPPGIYSVEHFDVHFYAITEQQRSLITAAGEDTARVLALPPVAYRPQDYLPDPQGVPNMGLHWADPNSPEFNGQPFTRTLIYGSYDGEFIFVEPMVALSYLRTNPNESLPIKQPAQYPVPNRFYAANYSVRYNAATAEYTIALENLVLRN
jgi:hypothetical protein